MIKPETFAVIGGDLRFRYVAGLLANDGCKVIAVGFDNTDLPPCVAGCTDMSQAIALADAVVLPMPVTTDGSTVQAPFSRLSLPLEQVYAAAHSEQMIVGGGVSTAVREAFERRGCTIQDYMQREELALRNAVPTAEGALQLAMEELPITLHGAACLITGFGRIAQVLALQLRALGADVTVAARKAADREKARLLGCKAVPTAALGALPYMDVVFNTVPAMLFDRRVLTNMDAHTLLIDLASRPGGIDFDAAASLHFKTVWALSLPGRVAPKTAARIIADTVLTMAEEVSG